MTYAPKPLDTAGIKLPPKLNDLLEILAKNTHENWAHHRLGEGWSFGLQRDDLQKEHPCLVPYDNLPDSEKKYDLHIASEIIRTILALGYKIEPPGDPVPDDRRQPASGAASFSLSFDFSDLDLRKAIVLWQAVKAKNIFFTREFHQKLSQSILQLGEPIISYDVAMEGLRLWPDDLRLRQLQALALLRSGAIPGAKEVLDQLHKQGHRDEETLGLLARTQKDLAALATDPHEREILLRQSFSLYAAAFKKTGGYWTGINAATIARLLGETKKARALAKKVYEHCLPKLSRAEDLEENSYWLKATLAEAALIREELPIARDWYTQAAQAVHRRYGDLGSSWRNARLLMDTIGLSPGERQDLESCFNLPAVVVFAGQTLDRPDTSHPGCPPDLEPRIGNRIKARLKKLEAGIGYSSCTSGAEVLFLEAMLQRHGEINVVLPFEDSYVTKICFDIGPESSRQRRFAKIMKNATQTVIASDKAVIGNNVVYEYANLIKYGLAQLRSAMLNGRLIPLAVWDGKPENDPAGINSQVQYWRAHGLEPEIIDPAALLKETAVIADIQGQAVPPRAEIISAPPAISYVQEIKGLLFADVVNYSRLQEEQIPYFVEKFMGGIFNFIHEYPAKPLLTNTWGDSLFCVFDSVRESGIFALNLRDYLCTANWRQYNLPQDLNIRISLHAGPVFYCRDAPFPELKYSGFHINRAARIEPITPPGQVYASQQFAALASSQHLHDFICDYVGKIPLPKTGAAMPIYLVRPGM